jgi:hypothetical protein
MKFSSILLIICCLKISCNSIYAFPQAAGNCTHGRASVGGAHLNNPRIFSGTLSEGGIDVMIDHAGLILDPNVAHTLDVGVAYSIQVASKFYPFKGILIRVEGSDETIDASSAILPDDITTKDAMLCKFPASGIDHIDSTEKRMSSGTRKRSC